MIYSYRCTYNLLILLIFIKLIYFESDVYIINSVSIDVLKIFAILKEPYYKIYMLEYIYLASVRMSLLNIIWRRGLIITEVNITVSYQGNLRIKRNARLSRGLVPLDSVNGNLPANGPGHGVE